MCGRSSTSKQQSSKHTIRRMQQFLFLLVFGSSSILLSRSSFLVNTAITSNTFLLQEQQQQQSLPSSSPMTRRKCNNSNVCEEHEKFQEQKKSTTPELGTSKDMCGNLASVTKAVVVPSQLNIPFTCQYHSPPPSQSTQSQQSHVTSSSLNASVDDYYNNNTTPFGDILRGIGPARILYENDNVLAFVDRTPQSKTLHALVIPKRYIPTIVELEPSDLPLVKEMKAVGELLLQQYKCDTNYRMVFHVPPYNTVDHLHLHVLCNDDLSIFGRTVKYVYDTPWCISLQTLLQNLSSESKE